MSKTNNEKIEEIKSELSNILKSVDSGDFDIKILEKLAQNLIELLSVNIVSKDHLEAKNISITIKTFFDMYINQRDYLKK
jgi:hypothetical protein